MQKISEYLVLHWFKQLEEVCAFKLFWGTALASFFSCHVLGAVYLCGMQLNIAVLFKAYIVVRKSSKLVRTHTSIGICLVTCLPRWCKHGFNEANNCSVVTTTMVNGLFEVSSITLAVKNLLTCLIYLVWGNCKKSAVLFCVKWGQAIPNSLQM